MDNSPQFKIVSFMYFPSALPPPRKNKTQILKCSIANIICSGLNSVNSLGHCAAKRGSRVGGTAGEWGGTERDWGGTPEPATSTLQRRLPNRAPDPGHVWLLGDAQEHRYVSAGDGIASHCCQRPSSTTSNPSTSPA